MSHTRGPRGPLADAVPGIYLNRLHFGSDNVTVTAESRGPGGAEWMFHHNSKNCDILLLLWLISSSFLGLFKLQLATCCKSIGSAPPLLVAAPARPTPCTSPPHIYMWTANLSLRKLRYTASRVKISILRSVYTSFQPRQSVLWRPRQLQPRNM